MIVRGHEHRVALQTASCLYHELPQDCQLVPLRVHYSTNAITMSPGRQDTRLLSSVWFSEVQVCRPIQFCRNITLIRMRSFALLCLRFETMWYGPRYVRPHVVAERSTLVESRRIQYCAKGLFVPQVCLSEHA